VSATVTDLRRAKKMSRRLLAERAGVAESTIASIESGRNLPNITTFEAVLYELGSELVVRRYGEE